MKNQTSEKNPIHPFYKTGAAVIELIKNGTSGFISITTQSNNYNTHSLIEAQMKKNLSKYGSVEKYIDMILKREKENKEQEKEKKQINYTQKEFNADEEKAEEEKRMIEFKAEETIFKTIANPQRVIKRMSNLMKRNLFRNIKFVTLTFAREPSGYQEAKSKLVKMNRRLKDKFGKNYDGFYTFERGEENGRIHIHGIIVMPFINSMTFQNKYWKEGFVKIKSVKGKTDKNKSKIIVKYITKYITKESGLLPGQRHSYFISKGWFSDYKKIFVPRKDKKLLRDILFEWKKRGFVKVIEHYTTEKEKIITYKIEFAIEKGHYDTIEESFKSVGWDFQERDILRQTKKQKKALRDTELLYAVTAGIALNKTTEQERVECYNEIMRDYPKEIQEYFNNDHEMPDGKYLLIPSCEQLDKIADRAYNPYEIIQGKDYIYITDIVIPPAAIRNFNAFGEYSIEHSTQKDAERARIKKQWAVVREIQRIKDANRDRERMMFHGAGMAVKD